MPIDLTERLPRTLALVVGTGTTVFLWSLTAESDALGMGSSTSGLGYVFGPFYGAMAGAAAELVGHLMRAWLRRTDVELPVPRAIPVLAIIVAAAGAMLWGRHVARGAAEGSTPRVMTDIGRLTGIIRPDTTAVATFGEALLLGGAATDTVSWNGTAVSLDVDSLQLVLASADGAHRLALDLGGLEKLFRVDAFEVRVAPDQPRAMVLVAIGVPGSHRMTLAVIDPAWQLIYQERLSRVGDIHLPRLARWALPTGGDLFRVMGAPEARRVMRLR
jgi:hypothetical protein